MAFDPLTAIFETGKMAIERIWPDANKRAEELRKLEELRQSGDLAVLNAHVQLLIGQIEINKIEAAHRSIWVAGWRPAVGWTCCSALLYKYIAYPTAELVIALTHPDITVPPLDTEQLIAVLMAILGIGGLRTLEKINGVTK